LEVKPEIGIIYHPDFFLHTNAHHPEKKERLEAILTILKDERLFEKMEQLAPLPAEIEEVARVHTEAYIKSVRELCERGRSYLDADTYLTPHSYEVALLSAGGALKAVRTVLEGRLKACYSLGRPPGHHAETHRGMGFCIFNNGAIAAKEAIEKYGISRILYLDWDVHHGNGTQETFYQDPRVLFMSVHQSPAFPGSGYIDETGKGEGSGYTVNVPLPPGSGDEEYAAVFREIVEPLADAFKPELLFVSAGQDAYHDDPLAGMRLSFAGYANMARHVREIADRHCEGRVVLFLEGGYHLRGQAEAVVTTLSELGQWNRPLKQETVHKSGSIDSRAMDIITAARQASTLINVKREL
jgi:acetoin utilization deacetylase AcuC-like enzyme